MAQINLLAFEMPRRPVRFYSQTILPNGNPMNYTKNPNAAVLGDSDGDDLIYNSPFGTFFQMDNGTYYYKKSKPNTWVIIGTGDTTGGDGITGTTNLGNGIIITSGIIDKNLQINSFIGSGNTSISKVGDDIIIYSSGDSITGATNGLNVNGKNIELGGVLSKPTEIKLGSNNLIITGTSGSSTVKMNSLTYLDGNQAEGNVLVSKADGEAYWVKTIETEILTGATNGLTKDNDIVKLGGILTESTIITDDRVTKVGIEYGADYSNSYTPRSLVDKEYVDSIASGLQSIGSVKIATTNNITLSGLQTIDNIPTLGGDRILVKNQINLINNGIYVVNSGAWTRSIDFDGNPNGEVSNGNLVPVESGNTQSNTLWVLTTPSPINVGVSELNFTLFSRVLGVTAGNGIVINPVNSNQQISVKLINNSGLILGVGGLGINNNIAGIGLDYNSGVINVNVSEINSLLGNPITGATNGLNINGKNIELGGVLSKPTEIKLGSNNLIITGTSGSSTVKMNNLTYLDGNQAEGNVLVSKADGEAYWGEAIESELITGATNGLNKDGDVVKLGGILTESTIITDNRVTKVGIQYGADYSNSYTPRSLVDKGYVTELVSGISGGTSGNLITGATNGLNKDGDVVKLGGFLSEPTIITDNRTTKVGIEYGADYSTTFTPRSLVDAAYVTGLTSGIAGSIVYPVTGATNGLALIDKNVELGGTFTNNISISGGTNSTFRIDVGTNALGSIYISPNDVYAIMNSNDGTISAIGVSDKYAIIYVGNTSSIILNNDNISLNSGGVVNFNSDIRLNKIPDDGIVSDSILVWDSVDKNIKKINSELLGEKNNKFAHEYYADGDFTLTIESPYIILVDSSTAETNLTLPANPFIGQAFKIKDIGGYAGLYNITINGNGNIIDDAITTLVNTNYGAIELYFAENVWSVLSFVN